MEKPARSSLQNLSISYECALAIGNSLNLSEMLHEVIHTIVHKTNAHRGIIWVKNGEQELQPVASAGITLGDVQAQGEIMDLRDVFNQIQQRQQFVLRHKDDDDFLQYCPVRTGKEESVLIVPVTNVAILHLVYAGREIADEPLANLLAGLSKKLSVAVEACMAHENIIKEIQVRVEAEEELKKKSEQLISSEEKYRTIYDSSKDAIMMLTPEEGFFSGNPAAVEIFGCKDNKEFISRTPHDLSPQYQPDGALSSEKAEQMMAIAMEKGSHFFEWTHKRMDDQEFLTTVLLTRIELQGRRLLQATVRDITKQKAADNTLRESEEKYRNIIENIQDIFYRGDMEGNLVMISASGAKQMGYDSVEAMIGLDIAKTFYAVPEEREGFLKVLEKTGVVNDYEITLKKKNGTLMPVRASSQLYFDKSGNPLGVEGLFSDITERKRAKQEIENLQRYNRGLIEVSIDLLVTFDHKGIILDVNRAMLQATGRTREELIGTPFADYFTDPERAYKSAMLAFEIEGIRDYELVMKARDGGTETIVSYNTSIYRNQAGDVVGAFASARDITERKAAEEEVKKRSEELKVFNKLAVGRELKMIELKKEINALLEKLGKEPEYKIVGDA